MTTMMLLEPNRASSVSNFSKKSEATGLCYDELLLDEGGPPTPICSNATKRRLLADYSKVGSKNVTSRRYLKMESIKSLHREDSRKALALQRPQRRASMTGATPTAAEIAATARHARTSTTPSGAPKLPPFQLLRRASATGATSGTCSTTTANNHEEGKRADKSPKASLLVDYSAKSTTNSGKTKRRIPQRSKSSTLDRFIHDDEDRGIISRCRGDLKRRSSLLTLLEKSSSMRGRRAKENDDNVSTISSKTPVAFSIRPAASRDSSPATSDLVMTGRTTPSHLPQAAPEAMPDSHTTLAAEHAMNRRMSLRFSNPERYSRRKALKEEFGSPVYGRQPSRRTLQRRASTGSGSGTNFHPVARGVSSGCQHDSNTNKTLLSRSNSVRLGSQPSELMQMVEQQKKQQRMSAKLNIRETVPMAHLLDMSSELNSEAAMKPQDSRQTTRPKKSKHRQRRRASIAHTSTTTQKEGDALRALVGRSSNTTTSNGTRESNRRSARRRASCVGTI